MSKIKKYRKEIITICIILFICAGYHVLAPIFIKIPLNPPKTTIRYNDKLIPTSLGDHNWIPKEGGSSYETQGEYTVGVKTTKFEAKPNDILKNSIPWNPKSVCIYQILGDNLKYKKYKIYKAGKEYEFKLPAKRGQYVFEVFAKWDEDRHNTATIFQVDIQ